MEPVTVTGSLERENGATASHKRAAIFVAFMILILGGVSMAGKSGRPKGAGGSEKLRGSP
jgi:hypothetical protein